MMVFWYILDVLQRGAPPGSGNGGMIASQINESLGFFCWGLCIAVTPSSQPHNPLFLYMQAV
jgi:hypothetical protein